MTDHEISELASRQYGLFSRSQAFECGAGDDRIKQRLHAGRWMAMAPGVYGLPGWPDSWRRRLMLAHLDVGPDSVVSHEAAAALHGVATFGPGRLVLTVAHGHHERWSPGLVVHQSTDLRPCHCTEVDGLPVTTVARTLFDLAGVTTSRARLERALDDAHARRRCRVEEVRVLYDELRRPRKRGMRLLGEVLAERGPGYVPPESLLERRLLKVLGNAALPTPRRQHPLPWRPEAEGRIDLAYPAARVLIEADGRRWHTRMNDFDVDRSRDNEALNHGWRPYRFTWRQITKAPAEVVRTVRQALALVP
ncbi:MAG: hypothetical protein M3N68_08680 [Actinomycetota bacterium]|nr:hypothetical protein [Actinomycetota bacterium]